MLVTTSSTTTTHSNRRTMYRHMVHPAVRSGGVVGPPLLGGPATVLALVDQEMVSLLFTAICV